MQEKPKVRSSLKVKNLNFDYHSNNCEKKIQFIIENKPGPRRSYIKDPKTPYISYDGEEDIYLKKIADINKMDQSKEKLEELARKIDNEYNSKDPIDVIFIEEEAKENSSDCLKEKPVDYRKYNHPIKGTEGFVDVEAKIDSLIDVETVNETLKNTFYNKFLGKLNKEI